uniref:Ferric-chelate reductase 1 n=1 Tax=Anthurium amnicola TaxID=1678845 RepID=A0A1D1YGT7_9ARAE
MKKRIFILLLIAIFVFLQSGVNGQSSSKCVDHGFCFKITPPEAVNDPAALYTFELEAPASIGWVAIGVGPSMIGSYIMMAWPSSNGSAIISQRVVDRYTVPKVTSQQDDLRLDVTSSGTRNGKFTARFTRAVSVSGSAIESGSQQFVWALQTEERPPADVSTSEIYIHNAKGRYTLEASAIVAGLSVSTLSKYEKYIMIHGLVMFSVWAIVVPAAIFIARFTRNIIPQQWFRLHWGIQQFIASPLTLFGLIMSLAAGVRFNAANTHHFLGLVVFGGFIFQLALGWIHHKLYDQSRKYYPWWTKLHWWWGRILVLLAFIQILLGLQQYNATHGIFVAYYIYILLILASFAGLSYHLYRKRKHDLETYAKSDVVYTGVRQDDIEQQSLLVTST